MGVASGCGFKEIYRFPHTTYPYSSCICTFLQQHPYCFVHFVNVFIYTLSPENSDVHVHMEHMEVYFCYIAYMNKDLQMDSQTGTKRVLTFSLFIYKNKYN